MSNADTIKQLLESANTIALVGASDKPHRASYRVMAFLLEQGYTVWPINPAKAGGEILGQPVLASLADINEPIDMVDIFRNADAAGEAVDEAIAVGARAVWLQLGVINPTAAQKAQAAGLTVVMDHCPKIEIPLLGVTTPAQRV